MDDEKRLPPHLRGIPPALRDGLTIEDKRAMADLHTLRARRVRKQRAEGFVPPPVAALLDAEEEPVGTDAGRLWMELPTREPADEAEVRRAAKRAGLDAERTEAALLALQRAELATRGPEGVTRHSPGSVPF